MGAIISKLKTKLINFFFLIEEKVRKTHQKANIFHHWLWCYHTFFIVKNRFLVNLSNYSYVNWIPSVAGLLAQNFQVLLMYLNILIAYKQFPFYTKKVLRHLMSYNNLYLIIFYLDINSISVKSLYL